MSYIVRRQTLGLAQDVYNDLITNMAHVENYEDPIEFERDLQLFALLGAWLRQEKLEEANRDS